MIKINRAVIWIILISFLFVFWEASIVSSLDPKDTPRPGPSTEELKKPSGVRVPSCSDLKANLTIRKRTVDKQGIFELHGQVCNVGTADYNNTDGAIAKLEWIYPEFKVSEVFQSSTFKNLAKGNCIDLKATRTIRGFIQWGGRVSPQSGACRFERQAKVSVLPIQKPHFSGSEDCKDENNVAWESVIFWTECTK